MLCTNSFTHVAVGAATEMWKKTVLSNALHKLDEFAMSMSINSLVLGHVKLS